MATSHLKAGRYIPHFDLNSLIFILSFCETFSYFATSWKWYCLTFWISKKLRLFRRFFQYSVICLSSKYIRLALTDFNKNREFYRCGNNRQIKKKISLRKHKKIHCQFCFLCWCWCHKNWKTRMFSFEHAHSTWAMYACNCKTIGSHLNSNSGDFCGLFSNIHKRKFPQK